MENKIVTAIFKDSTHTKVSDVWQYDYGQILRIQGLDLPTAVEVDFAVAGASESIARIGTTKDGVTDVVIPDSLIETGNNLVAYIYLRDAESGNTEYQIDMLVTKRAKPEAYDRPEDKELFGQAIEAVNTAADRAEKARQTAQEAAQKAGLDAEQTAQDRVEVAKMVETVTDISEQVKKVEGLSNKAQESATQAGTSATAAEKAKAQAETAAGKTAEDRIAVNQAKIDVDEVQKAVRADRAAVEEAKQSVEQLSNAIPESTQVGVQAVNQAKQTAVDEIARIGISHKAAVEGAGTQAVENVENVKASATEAVEIVKTEAVQSVQTEGNTQTGNVTTEGTKQVKAVQDKGNEVLQSIPEDFQMQMESKLDKQQGVENKGKALVIGEDGNVAPGEVQSGGRDGIAIINTMSGESPLAIPDSAERVNKRLELVGKTEQNQDPPPSPEYPQEIKNSGKWNEGTQKYEIVMQVKGADTELQSLTLTSDRPITKWDRLVEQGGQIGWLYGTKKYTVTGSENYIFGGAQYYSGISTNMYINAAKNTSGEGVCRRLKSIIGIWDKSNNTKDGFCINSGNQIHMRFFNNLLGVSDDATMEEKKAAYIAYLKKEYEKGTPYEIVYQSLEPEFIPLPQSEQNAIRALKTYYPTTVITADGGELDPDIKVTYTADTKNYIDNKVSAKVASIIRQYRLNTANLLSLMPMETQATMIENDTNNILENAEEMKHE